MLVVTILVALAVLGPLLGADSRDGLDWTPNAFWLRRRSAPRRRRPEHRSAARLDAHRVTSGDRSRSRPETAGSARPPAETRAEAVGCLAA